MLADRVRIGSYGGKKLIDLIGFGPMFEGEFRMGNITGIAGVGTEFVDTISSDFFPLYYDGWHEFYDYTPPINNTFPYFTIQYSLLDEETEKYVPRSHTFMSYNESGELLEDRLFDYNPMAKMYNISIGSGVSTQKVGIRGEFILRRGDKTGKILYKCYYDAYVGQECYLTTAMVGYFGKDDDGIELNSMRKLREKYKYKHADTLVEYEKVSPHIIQGIEQSGNRDYWYSEIKKIVDKIVIWVSNEEWEKAEIAYLNLYIELKDLFYSEVRK